MISFYGFKNIQLVVFDKDGTLIDSNIFWSEVIRRRANALIEKFDLPSKDFEQLCSVLGLDCKTSKLLPAGPIAIVSRNRVIEIVVEFLLFNYKISTDVQTIAMLFDQVHKKFEPFMSDYIKAIDGVERALQQLHGKVPMAVTTSDGRVSTINALTQTNLIQYFDTVITRDDCPEQKVTGIPLKQLLEKYNILPENTVVVGDAKMDYDMATAAGVHNVLLVASGQTPIQELRASIESVRGSIVFVEQL